jgi:flagellar motility protein MotE (MotC chaperone)
LKINKTFIKRARTKIKKKRTRTKIEIPKTKMPNMYFLRKERDKKKKNIKTMTNHLATADMRST